jgi:ribosomal protein S18 acetylase RimI-like enzyme
MDDKRFVIEVAEESDLKELTSFFSQHGQGLPPFPYQPDAQGRYSVLLIDQMFRNPYAAIFIVLEKNTEIIVGHTSVHLVASMAGRRAELEMLLVHHAYRGQGIGRALLLEALETARGVMGCDWAVCYNEPDKFSARHLLLELGFELEPFSDRRLRKWLR